MPQIYLEKRFQYRLYPFVSPRIPRILIRNQPRLPSVVGSEGDFDQTSNPYLRTLNASKRRGFSNVKSRGLPERFERPPPCMGRVPVHTRPHFVDFDLIDRVVGVSPCHPQAFPEWSVGLHVQGEDSADVGAVDWALEPLA